MAKQSFSVGQVLTAAQMTSLQSTAMLGGSATAKTANYVLVAADAGTVVSVNSTSATTITVNSGLFSAGDTVTIQNWGSGAVTITAGTATVNTAGSLIVPQYDGGVLYFTTASAAIYFDFVQAGAVSPLTTKGDLYGFGSSDARIPIGTNNQVLTADSGETLGLKWATPAGGGGMTLISTTTLSGVTTTLSSIPQTFESLYLLITGVTINTNNNIIRCLPNNVTNLSNTTGVMDDSAGGSAVFGRANARIFLVQSNGMTFNNSDNAWALTFNNYISSTRFKPFSFYGAYQNSSGGPSNNYLIAGGAFRSNTAITSLVFDAGGTDTLAGGTVLLYGVK